MLNGDITPVIPTISNKLPSYYPYWFIECLLYTGIIIQLCFLWASLVTQMVKNVPSVQETSFDPWIRKIPWRRKWLPTQVLLPGEFHGQRSLVDYSPWGCRVRHDWVTSTLTHTHTHTHTHTCFFSFALQIVSPLALGHSFIFLLCPVDIIVDFSEHFLTFWP